MQFPTELTPWPTEGLRRVSVASFGYGGSNAHIVLDDAFNFLQRRQLVGPSCSIRHSLSTPRANSPSENKLPSQVFMWSTEDEAGIDRMIESYSKYFQALDLTPPEDSSLLSQIASTLTEKRSQLKWRSFAIVDSITAIGNNLKDIVSTPVRAGTALNAVLGIHGTSLRARNPKEGSVEESIVFLHEVSPGNKALDRSEVSPIWPKIK